MNKTFFINELKKELNCDDAYARIVLDLYEENFIIGNKKNTMELFVNSLKISSEEANNLYEVCSGIVASSLKDRVLHPFKNNKKNAS